MIRLDDRGWLVWEEEDHRCVVRIIGSLAASKNKFALVPSFLKKAKAKGIRIQRTLNERLNDEIELRDELRPIRRGSDYPIELLPDFYDRDLLRALFPHQRVSLAYMQALDAYLLADQPGVGKTAPSIMWADKRVRDEGRILVVTPGSARGQWARAIEHWSPGEESIRIVEGRITEQEAIIASDQRWTISHWEALVHARDAMLDQDWAAIILDESHAIKNRDTKRAETAFALSDASFKLCLSGHPYTKTPDELWSQLRFLYPETYGSYWRFFSMHIESIEQFFGGLQIVGPRLPKLLRWEIAPFVLRRTKRKVFKSLPRITRVARYVDLSKKAQGEYKRLLKEMFVELEGRDKRLPVLNALSRTTRVRQFLVDPSLLESKSPAPKYAVVLELLDELDGPPVIFTTFAQAAKRLAKYLKKKGKKPGLLIGGRKSKKAKAAEATIQTRFLDGELDALIVTMQKGGSALNLGKYGFVIFLDLPHTFKDLEQCEGRVDRPEENTGKIVPTTAIRIITRGTYEEKTQEKKLEKRKLMFDEVFTQGQLEELF